MNDSSRKPVAIVTGGSGYLGRAIVGRLLKCDWDIVVISRNPTVIDGVRTIACDITDETAVRAAIETIIHEHKAIDALIHAAAPPIERIRISETSSESLDRAVRTAMTGFSLLVDSILPYMMANGSIVGITTQLLETPESADRTGAYTHGKQALRTYLKNLSSELKEKSIRVYAIAPGFLPGGLNSDLPKAVQAYFAKESGVADPTDAAAEIVENVCTNREMFLSGVSISSPTRKTSPL